MKTYKTILWVLAVFLCLILISNCLANQQAQSNNDVSAGKLTNSNPISGQETLPQLVAQTETKTPEVPSEKIPSGPHNRMIISPSAPLLRQLS
jgi:hypothetical protein